MRTRNFYYDAKTPVYVSGMNGTVAVTLTAGGYRIDAER